MSLGGKQKTQEQVVKNEAPAYLQPYLTQVAGDAQRLYQTRQTNPLQYYPNNTVAPMSAETEQALQAQAQLAGQGGASRAAAGNLQSTLSGDFLNANPYIDNVVNSSLRSLGEQYTNVVNPALQSTFASSGRYGSGAQASAFGQAADAFAKTAGDTASNIYYQNYNNERGRQMQAAGLAPSIDAARYTDAAQLAQVGTARENYAQNLINEEVNRYNFNQNQQGMNIDEFIARLSGVRGSDGVKTGITQTPRSNPLLGALGGATSVAGGYGALKDAGIFSGSMASPWGYGALIGGSLLGALG